MKQFKISEKEINELLSYLGTRPFSEVVGVIHKLTNLPETKDHESPPVLKEVPKDG